ncbi:MAG: VTT domain-containing protein [Candidatus Acidiferrales bacterium]
MLSAHDIAVLVPTTARGLRRSLLHLGGVGLIPLALLDNSPLPIPGAMDVATIVLAARAPQWWIYYALMATIGSVIGGYVTYRLSRKGGKEALERKFSRQKITRVTKIFERWGFGSIAIPALIPPPMPMVPFLFAAGAMQYPVRKFLAALTLGRAVRYTILAYLGERYGHQIIAVIVKNGHPVIVGIALAVVAIVAAAIYFWQRSSRKTRPRTAAQRS